MLSPAIAFLRRTIHSLIADSPQRLAGGFALGMVIGLVPKANLIALTLCVLLVSLRVNKGLAVAAAVVISVFSPWMDPFTHKLGASVLAIDSLQATYAWLYNLPLGPWLGFHNTVVTGSLLLGAYLAYPIYWMVAAACRRMHIAAAAGENHKHPRNWEARQNKSLHGAAP
jgi:uncharacterized protein (TIGR03546 family)